MYIYPLFPIGMNNVNIKIFNIIIYKYLLFYVYLDFFHILNNQLNIQFSVLNIEVCTCFNPSNLQILEQYCKYVGLYRFIPNIKYIFSYERYLQNSFIFTITKSTDFVFNKLTSNFLYKTITGNVISKTFYINQ